MSAVKRSVFSLHGIGKQGKWQDGVKTILDPFFRYEPLIYPEYRKWGGYKVALEPLTGVLVLGAFAAMIAVGWVHSSITWVIASAATGIVYFGARVCAAFLRDRVIDSVYVQITEGTKYGSLPHLIAHSFGTYTVGMALLKYPAFAFDTAIFSGCVLSKAFPWKQVSSRFEHVYNEVAGKDLVPLVASLIGWIVPKMGGAGRSGFSGPNGFVHSLSDVDAFCRKCEHPSPACAKGCSTLSHCAARIHNVHYKLFDHGSFSIGQQHARKYWLPLLWGLDPLLYDEFIRACIRCAELEIGLDRNEALVSDFNEAEQTLRLGCWGWTNGSLEAFVIKELDIRLRQLCDGLNPERSVGLVIRGVYSAVSLAAGEANKATARDDELMLALFPRIAVARAIKGVLAAVRP